ncbi:MAG: ribonuclease H family protein [Bacteroidaceae bacterium]|nr:ribonuclease H family protein [Bacteroidaceae bacterium]
MAKNKYYVVWHGVEPGIYTDWDACKQQINGFEGAIYKSFSTREEAEEAYNSSPYIYITRAKKNAGDNSKVAMNGSQVVTPPTDRTDTVLPLPLEVQAESLAVDAACSGNPGPMEYRGVYLRTGQVVFHFGPVHGTNNIGEFLAIVHALALMKQKGVNMPIYSDSRNAILWVKQKKCKTKLERTPRTEELYQLIERAEKWLKENKYTTPILKWDTSRWGEVPADFGRK